MTPDEEKKAVVDLVTSALGVCADMVDQLINTVPDLPRFLEEMNSELQQEMVRKVGRDHPVDQERVHMKANVFWGFSELVRYRIRQRDLDKRIKMSEEARRI